jgi:hypothetical protein
MLHLADDAFLIRYTKPLKVTFTRGQFFPGLEGKKETVGMVHAHVSRTAPVSLVPCGILVAVLTFYFFHHGDFLCSSFHRYFFTVHVF